MIQKEFEKLRNTIHNLNVTLRWIAIWLFIIAMSQCSSCMGCSEQKIVDTVREFHGKEPFYENK